MSRLAPNLFNRRYDELVQIGRSRLPSYAPAWTDHNAHDPGITLIELLSWVAEAQIYSLARTRRDERQAYAALMGIEAHGARAARGLIWPDHNDPLSPAATTNQGRVMEREWPIGLDKAETPNFQAVHRQLWIPARIDGLKSRLADGTVVDHLMANRRGGPAFQPFGGDEGRDAVLRLELGAIGYAPLFEPGRPDDARLVIGVRADAARGAPSTAEDDGVRRASPVEVTLLANGDRIRLPVVEDSTQGMVRTGVLVLDVSGIEVTPAKATIEIRAPNGFERAPRILRIEPNVVPVIQRRESTVPYESNGWPDQGFDLETPGLEFEPGSDPVRIKVGEETWSKTDRLADCGPGDRKFVLDPVAARISFGNGVNGAIPPSGALVTATYFVSDGQQGNLAANRKWVVRGFSGLFGVNPDATSGGEDPSGWLEQRRDARRAISERHPLVSGRDFEEAARGLPGLEIGRASMLPASAGDVATGTMRLVAMRTGPGTGEPDRPTETARWLEAVRSRLAPRTPLGSRIRVVAPRYVGFSVRAEVEAEPKKDFAEVRQGVIDELVRRLTLVSTKPGIPQRPFGLPVTSRDLRAWIQALPDVRQVRDLSIVLAGGRATDQVKLPPSGLPRIDIASSQISVAGIGSGGAP